MSLQSLAKIVAALKETTVALQTQAALLEQQKEILEAGWHREATPQPRQRAPCTSLGGYLIV
jgi:hypothetical protein